jgi:succinyl-diaminopimelate desuccinylase
MNAETLAQRTLDLVDIPSVSRDEAAIARYVAEAVPLERAFDDGDSVLYTTPRSDDRELVVLAGHLDTVPAQGNLPGRREGDAVVGLGASDMKGGLAVMIELARWAADAPDLAFDLGFLFFPREEIGPEASALPAFFDGCAELDAAGLVLLLEPTDNTIQAGCLGNISARIVFRGESAHSARPWLGVNAVAVAFEGLQPVLAVVPQPVEVNGLTFVEVLSVTRINGGIADNVIPDRVEVTLNYRYAPSRTPEEAAARLSQLAPGAEILAHAPPGRVVSSTPLVEQLRRAGPFDVEPKQAWTNVADFTSRGIDAVNLGPGATRYAHRRDERVEAEELLRTYDALKRFASV